MIAGHETSFDKVRSPAIMPTTERGSTNLLYLALKPQGPRHRVDDPSLIRI